VLLAGGLLALILALAAVFVTQSVVGFVVAWIAAMIGVVVLARVIWRGPRFWPFLIVLVVVWVVASGIGYALADAAERAPGDAAFWPLVIFGFFWLGGFIGGILLSRRVALPKREE
jgi:energy-coupling factor transporter transmembrane protein EcfT